MLEGTITRTGRVKCAVGINPRYRFFLFRASSSNEPAAMARRRNKCFSMKPLSLKRGTEESVVLALRSVKFRVVSSRRRVTPTRRRVSFRCSRTVVATSGLVAFGVIIGAVTGQRNLRTAFVPGPGDRACKSKVRVGLSLYGGSKAGTFCGTRSRGKLDRRKCCFVNNLVGRVGTVAYVAGPAVGSCGHFIPKCRTPICVK